MTRSTLVTGATGYVGGELIPALLERGHRVRALARKPENASLPAGVGLLDAVDRRGDRQAEPAVRRHPAQGVDIVVAVAAIAGGRALRRGEAVALFPHADRAGSYAGLLRNVLDRQVSHVAPTYERARSRGQAFARPG